MINASTSDTSSAQTNKQMLARLLMLSNDDIATLDLDDRMLMLSKEDVLMLSKDAMSDLDGCMSTLMLSTKDGMSDLDGCMGMLMLSAKDVMSDLDGCMSKLMLSAKDGMSDLDGCMSMLMLSKDHLTMLMLAEEVADIPPKLSMRLDESPFFEAIGHNIGKGECMLGNQRREYVHEYDASPFIGICSAA